MFTYLRSKKDGILHVPLNPCTNNNGLIICKECSNIELNINNGFQVMIYNFEIYCKYNNNQNMDNSEGIAITDNVGCLWNGKINEYFKHLKNCKYCNIICPFAVYGCNAKKLTRNNIDKHFKDNKTLHESMKIEYELNLIKIENQRLRNENNMLTKQINSIQSMITTPEFKLNRYTFDSIELIGLNDANVSKYIVKYIKMDMDKSDKKNNELYRLNNLIENDIKLDWNDVNIKTNGDTNDSMIQKILIENIDTNNNDYLISIQSKNDYFISKPYLLVFTPINNNNKNNNNIKNNINIFSNNISNKAKKLSKIITKTTSRKGIHINTCIHLINYATKPIYI